MEEAQIDDSIDRISALPDSIIHQIVSFLTGKDLTKTAVLSKNWYRLRYSFPVLEFYQSDSVNPYSTKSMVKFLKLAKQTLLTFLDQDSNHGILKLGLGLILRSESVVLNLIEVAVDNNVQKLVISIDEQGCHPFYMPLSVFASNSIKVMRLSGFIRLWRPTINNYVDNNFNSVQKLWLDCYYVDEQFFSYLISISALS